MRVATPVPKVKAPKAKRASKAPKKVYNIKIVGMTGPPRLGSRLKRGRPLIAVDISLQVYDNKLRNYIKKKLISIQGLRMDVIRTALSRRCKNLIT